MEFTPEEREYMREHNIGTREERYAKMKSWEESDRLHQKCYLMDEIYYRRNLKNLFELCDHPEFRLRNKILVEDLELIILIQYELGR